MHKPILLLSAKNDVRESAKWYNAQQPGLGKRFTADVRKKMALIKQNPHAYSIQYGKIRTAMLDTFPYMIHFGIEDNKTISVYAVLHTSRNPNIWTDRTESDL